MLKYSQCNHVCYICEEINEEKHCSDMRWDCCRVMISFLSFFSSDIYRLNLERGQFLNPFVSEGSELNKIAMNPVHDLIIVGTKEGRIEAWDPRARDRVSSLDCSMSCMTDNSIE